MDENKEKLSGSDEETVDPIHEEMEELARVFKKELDKAREEAENKPSGFENLQVEGYNPQTVSRKEKKVDSDEEKLCEYCGEKPRGTEKNPNSPYCERCESALEKYPYDYRGIIVAIITLCVTIGAIFLFAINVPVFSMAKQGDKAVEEGRLFTALNKYDNAIEYSENISKKSSCFNLHAKRVSVNYTLVKMDSAITEIDEDIPEKLLKLPTFKNLNVVLEESERMQASTIIVRQHLGDETNITWKNYDEIVNKLEGLVGKKIYIKGTEYHYETEKDFTPDGTETVYTIDEGWIRMFQYYVAQQVGKDEKTLIYYLQKSSDSSAYMNRLVAPMLASSYVGIGEYEKAEEILANIKEFNVESAEWYMVESLLYRYRDKNYAAAQQSCDRGLKMLSGLPNGEGYVMQYGYMLQIQQVLNYIMQDEIDLAYDTMTDIYDNAFATGGLTIQMRDLYAVLAYSTGDTEVFEALEKEISSYGDDSIAFTSDVTDFKAGKITLKEIAESGRYDLV